MMLNPALQSKRDVAKSSAALFLLAILFIICTGCKEVMSLDCSPFSTPQLKCNANNDAGQCVPGIDDNACNECCQRSGCRDGGMCVNDGGLFCRC